MLFIGIFDKCKVCDKIVYFVDKFIVDNKVYYKVCFCCYYCNGIFKVYFVILVFFFGKLC